MFLLDAFRFCFPSYLPPRDSEVVDVEGGMERTGEEGKNHVCCWPLLLLAEHAHNLPIYIPSVNWLVLCSTGMAVEAGRGTRTETLGGLEGEPHINPLTSRPQTLL